MKQTLQRMAIWATLFLLALPVFARDFTYTYEGQTLTIY